MRILLFCVSLLAACGTDFSSIPQQELATKLVWNTAYRMIDDPPQIEWIKQPGLNCAMHEGQYRAFYRARWWGDPKVSGDCVAGVYFADWDITQVALPDGYLLSKTAFSHELLHAAMERDNRYDPMHLEPDWGSSQGRPYNVYDEAQRLLEENGL